MNRYGARVESRHRVHFSASTAELERLVRENWGRTAPLEAVAHELTFRRRRRALSLASKVEQRLRELASRRSAVPAGGVGVSAERRADRNVRSRRTFDIDAVSVGALAAAGYRVGRNGGPMQARRAALERVIRDEITDVDDVAYVASWGRPGSPERLRRAANVLAKLARGARKRGSGMDAARVAWSTDLGYLKRAYYDGRLERAFPWPSDRS